MWRDVWHAVCVQASNLSSVAENRREHFSDRNRRLLNNRVWPVGPLVVVSGMVALPLAIRFANVSLAHQRSPFSV
jgi:hypothetical protein